jgi:glycosyltransferase involved in cell wall biosynthesis
MTPRASVCMSTFNRPGMLQETLTSIARQSVPFPFEVIVVDDGPTSEETKTVCGDFPLVKYARLDREDGVCNPCIGRNVAYRLARGDVVICQSDEVIHVSDGCIEQLVEQLTPGHFIIANVLARGPSGKVWSEYTGPSRRVPFFFLGSVYRRDLYAIGGNDEEFAYAPAYDDVWFGDCLTKGLKLRSIYSTSIVGHHQYHPPHNNIKKEPKNRKIYDRKKMAASSGRGKWTASGAPWYFHDFKSDDDEGTFTSYWEQGLFYDASSGGVDESRSGAGSSLSATESIRQELPKLIDRLGVKSVLDIPCGDFHWMQEVPLTGVDYVGADIVRGMVAENQRRYSSNERRFVHLDMLSSDLPRADLVICRDGLVHLSVSDVRKFLHRLIASGSKYLLTTTFTDRGSNAKIQTGQWTPYNLQLPPFNLPDPLELIDEGCQEHYPRFKDKCLGLWRVRDLDHPPCKSMTICVDYDDFLSITLPRNARHFDQTLIVTSKRDPRTKIIAEMLGCRCHVTEAFYTGGAQFNKGAAMEEGLDVLGRDGWICTWDCDVVMPESIEILGMDRRCLYGPIRRILEHPQEFQDSLDWGRLPSPTNSNEWAGYFHLFHSSAMQGLPWYSVDWKHAGGCDSDFQMKFPGENLRRTPFDVLHLGPEGMPEMGTRVGKNWCGRVIPRIDGQRQHPNHRSHLLEVVKMVNRRKIFGTSMEKLGK